jgi:transcriptional regulator with XRE-family HTH domain
MLPKILKEKMRDRGLALRPAAEEIGISHTTLSNVLKGQPSDLDTIALISTWLGMPLHATLGMQDPDNETSAISAISALIEAEPALKEVFMDAGRMLEEGEITPNDLKDIAAYAAYRLQTSRGISNERSNKGASPPHRQDR